MRCKPLPAATAALTRQEWGSHVFLLPLSRPRRGRRGHRSRDGRRCESALRPGVLLEARLGYRAHRRNTDPHDGRDRQAPRSLEVFREACGVQATTLEDRRVCATHDMRFLQMFDAKREVNVFFHDIDGHGRRAADRGSAQESGERNSVKQARYQVPAHQGWRAHAESALRAQACHARMLSLSSLNSLRSDSGCSSIIC